MEGDLEVKKKNVLESVKTRTLERVVRREIPEGRWRRRIHRLKPEFKLQNIDPITSVVSDDNGSKGSKPAPSFPGSVATHTGGPSIPL